ncbi:MAG: RluA family pseudouridine synthase [Deltaproteobacteria bacterium]|nr:RluA family pseudouridine synthase [Deltaproteobacteria bacterium]
MRRARPEHPTLAAIVRERLGGSWGDARKLCETGKVSIDGVVCTDPARRVESGEVTVDREAPRVQKGALPPERWVYEDEHLVVVNKPPGVLSVPHSGERDTLLDRVRAPLGRGRGKKGRGKRPFIGVVHRIDKGTSGLLVFARSEPVQEGLKELFARHAIDRGYVALAHGAVDVGTHASWLLRNRGDGYRGSWGHHRPVRDPEAEPPSDAKHAVTHVKGTRRLKRASLVDVALETGRTHQIRIHLAEAGHPLLGESVYDLDYEGKRIEAPRVMLHAYRLGFVHPVTRKRLTFEQPPPGDFMAALKKLGGADWRP